MHTKLPGLLFCVCASSFCNAFPQPDHGTGNLIPRRPDDHDPPIGPLTTTTTSKLKSTSTSARFPTTTSAHYEKHDMNDSSTAVAWNDPSRTPVLAILVVLLLFTIINSAIAAYFLYRRYRRIREERAGKNNERNTPDVSVRQAMPLEDGGVIPRRESRLRLGKFARILPFPSMDPPVFVLGHSGTLERNNGGNGFGTSAERIERPLPSIPTADNEG
ncbi:hypothetical protein BJ742DRAFT_739468 [Cladochytrium replicatum]|nr:hypothetical protein BJ742DRAFT_739468 [Cladochytrium replicatum]